MAGLLPENIIQVTATRTSVTATAAMPVASDVVVTLRLETNYKVCDVTIQAGNTTGTASVQTSSIVRHCLITVAPAKDSTWRYTLQSDTVDIPLMPRNVITSTVQAGFKMTAVAQYPVSSDVTVTYRLLGVSPATDLCSITIPAGETTATVSFTPSSSARQVSIIISPKLDDDYEYSPYVNVLTVPAMTLTIFNTATATRISSRTGDYVTPVQSDVTLTVRLRGTLDVIATIVMPAGSASAYADIEPQTVQREGEVVLEPSRDEYMNYTTSVFLTIPGSN